MELVGNRNFTLTTANGKRSRYDASRMASLRDAIRPGILLFNIYTSDLPTTVSRKYVYANNLAIIHADGD